MSLPVNYNGRLYERMSGASVKNKKRRTGLLSTYFEPLIQFEVVSTLILV
jgi:hypothetical protein